MTVLTTVCRVSLKDSERFPTFVVAGPTRHLVWLYAHDLTPTVLRLHPPVVRFLRTALTELVAWFEQPVYEQAPLVWTLLATTTRTADLPTGQRDPARRWPNPTTNMVARIDEPPLAEAAS